MKNLEIKAKVLEYSKALLEDEVSLKVFISLLFKHPTCSSITFSNSGGGGRGMGGGCQRVGHYVEVQVVEDRKNIFFTNLLILNWCKGLSDMKYIM